MNISNIQDFPDAVAPELLNILIVDDQEYVRKIVCRRLNKIGINSIKEAVLKETMYVKCAKKYT